MSWMLSKIRRHHDRIHNGLTFNIKDDSIYHILSTSILPKALHVSHWRHLAFHTITSLKHKFAAMFIHIGYHHYVVNIHHYVVNIHFELVQFFLESCTTLKLTDRLTPTSCQMKWRSMLASIWCYVRYNVSSCKLP
jgi:hypothetical protein